MLVEFRWGGNGEGTVGHLNFWGAGGGHFGTFGLRGTEGQAEERAENEQGGAAVVPCWIGLRGGDRGSTMRSLVIGWAVACVCGVGAESLGPVDGWPCADNIPDDLCVESGTGARHIERKLPLQDTVAHVQSLLQTAIKVELSTIPVYLTTMYSIVNQSSFEALAMRGVVIEGTP